MQGTSGRSHSLAYCESLITQLEDPAYCGEMKASGSPFGVKIDEKKEHHPI